MHSVEDAIPESFAFVCTAQAAAEVEHCVVVIQWQGVQVFLQLLKAITNLRRIALVGFSIGLIELIQYCFATAVTGIKGMALNVGIQLLGNLIHNPTPLNSCARRTPRRIPSINPAFS